MDVSAYTTTKQGLVDVYSAAYLRSGYTTMNSNPSRVTAFGDSVRISPEAMALFAQSYTTLHDTKHVAADGNAAVEETASSPKAVEQSDNAPQAGDTNSGSVERQIQTLQGQLANLMAQIESAGPDTGLQGQIASVQSQLQALQAQLV